MPERNRTKDVLIGVMTIAMVILIVLATKQILSSGTSSSQNLPQSVEVFNDVTVASTTIRSFQNSAELEAFLKSGSSEAEALRIYLMSSTSSFAATTSSQNI